MANTFTQIYIQIVFAVKGRQNLIPQKNKEELHKYITGVVSKRGQKLLAINCMPDHVHIFIGLKPNQCISDLVRDIKTASSSFIKEKKWIRSWFEWQEGFGGFSYGHSQLDVVIKYIQRQETHHHTRSFKEEYLDFLEKFNVEYDKKYLFEFYE
jgi:REP element-mobilizing transposase RayT